MALTAPRIWLLDCRSISPAISSRLMRSSSASGWRPGPSPSVVREHVEAARGVAADGGLHVIEVADHGGDVGHLHLRRDQAGLLDAGAGRNVAGREPVEDGGRAQRHLTEAPDGIFGAADAVRAGARLRSKGAGPFGIAEQGFADLAVLRIGEVARGVARFGIEQNLGDDGLADCRGYRCRRS